MRLFLAGVVPDAVRKMLYAQLEPVRAATRQARWLPPESLHLTVVFLGSVPDASLAPLREAFGATCGKHRAIHLALDGVETFGPARSPTVLAATLSGDVEALQALVTDARQAVEPWVHLEPERRPFRPHLTVARARSSHGDQLLRRCCSALAHGLDGTFVLRDIALVKSDTLATGAVHTELARWTLAG